MRISRRLFLTLAALCGMRLLRPIRRAFGGTRVRRVEFSILHTNDIHGHLTPWQGWEGDLRGKTVGGLGRLAGAVRTARREIGENLLLLDAGDLIGDTMIADKTQGKALILALNSLGYHAMTVGNHEPDFGSGVLSDRIKDASFPVIAANLGRSDSGEAYCRPYIIKRVGGLKVGILGLAYPKTPWTTAKKNIERLDFQEPIGAVRRHLPQMKADGAECVIVLSHLGLGGDQHLARSVEGIHVIVGGHSHNRMREAEVVGETLIVQAGAHGSDLGRLDVTFEHGRITHHRRTLIPLAHDEVPGDPGAEAVLARLLEPYAEGMREVVGRASSWLVRAQTLAGQEARKRDAESPVDSLFADIIREITRSDVAFLPGVGYGVAIPPGDVTAEQLKQLLPHQGKIVTMRLRGSEVRDVLEQSLENTYTSDPKVKVGGMIQVSGMRFRYDPRKGRGERVLEIERDGRALDPEARYTIATNSLLATGGHNYQTLAKGQDRAEHGPQYETIRDWFQEHSPVSTPKPGRITRVGEFES